MDPIVRVRDLVHAYEHRPVLRVDELELSPGRYHLRGANGAGKTTLLAILSTLLRPSQGHVQVAGHLLPDEARQARAILGFAGHQPSLHASLPARQAIAMHARLHGLAGEHVDASLAAWHLADAAEDRVEALSHGQRRRLDLARCLLHEPQVALLDEPTSGLDEPATRILADRLQAADPELLIVAAPSKPPLDVEVEIVLEEGQLVEAPP